MNGFEAVAIIIAVFFIAGLMVGFLIVMALPALVYRRGGERWDREPGTGPYDGNPGGDDDGEDRDTGDQGRPPDHPW